MTVFPFSKRLRPSTSRRLPIALLGIGAACHSAANDRTAPAPAAVSLDVPASFDSTVQLAKFALRAIDGTVQLPRVRPHMTSVSTHYVRSRSGGGHTEVAIIAAVTRPTSASATMTRVDLSAWQLDVAHQLTPAQRRAGIPATAITTNAPALNRPRLVTAADTAHYQALGYVFEAFIQHGARRLP